MAKKLSGEELLKARKIPTRVYRNNAYQTAGTELVGEDGTNANTVIIMKNLEIADLPEIDLMDVNAVKARIREYFSIEAKYGYKPTVAGLGMALNGMSRARLWEIRTGNFGNVRGITTRLPVAVMDEIKKAYAIMEQWWEDYMQNGKINPVAGIFLGKNLYGYQDKTEYVLTPNTDGADYSEADIRARLGLPAGDGADQDGGTEQD